jgi:hypothetical protein
MGQKWEYCSINSFRASGTKSSVTFYGAVATSKQTNSLTAALWILGQAEWELIDFSGAVYVFKRPVQQGRATDDAMEKL